jgi:ADP-ribosylation factor GTPase-activating protein 2/3
VVITDDISSASADGTSTPAGEPADDFFSSWDKPTIKRPSNPPSRSGTPPVVSRTASPFLSAGGANGAQSRSKSPSPLAAATNDAGNDGEPSIIAPTAIRTTSSSAIRKTGAGAAAGAKRANVLSGKKPAQKLGAKKVVGEEIDFEAAEKAAKAEAERIEKLGYDPEAEKAEESSKTKPAGLGSAATPKENPAPINTASRSASNPSHARSPSEIERLGMGMNRLGFGQIGPAKGSAGSSSAPAPKKLGFGAVGAAKPAATEGKPDQDLHATIADPIF